MGKDKKRRFEAAVEKELNVVRRQESAMLRAALKAEIPRWKQALTDKVPDKVYENLCKAFCKAFAVIFEKGTGIIEKTYNREAIQEDCEIRNFGLRVKADRKSLRKVHTDAGRINLRNMAVTSVEGIGLGVLGIGLPDIVLFAGVLLKGIYEVALQYGFDYDSQEERYFILKLMETSMRRGTDRETAEEEIDCMIEDDDFGKQGDIENQIERTADAFAVDMVLLKFIQGLPVAGVIGGIGNPVYYRRVVRYAEVKYRKRYLLGWRKQAF